MASSEQPAGHVPEPDPARRVGRRHRELRGTRTTAEELDLQVAVAGPDGEATGFVFGLPQVGGDGVALSQPGGLALPREPPVDALVGKAVGLDVLLPGDMFEGDLFEPGGDAPGPAVERLQVRRLHPIAAGELADQEQAVRAERHGAGAELCRQREALDHRGVLRHVVRRLADALARSRPTTAPSSVVISTPMPAGPGFPREAPSQATIR